MTTRTAACAVAICLGIGLLLDSHGANAVPLYIDRTKRTIDVPAECSSATATAPFTQNLNYNNGAGVNVVNAEGRFTLVLSTTTRLLARAHNNAFELSWYNFDNRAANANYNAGLNDAKRLVRALVMLRCGLPITPNDTNLYQFPVGAAVAQTVQYAMGDRVGPDPRVPSGYTLIGNGEREALLMYAAERIKFDYTPTILGRGNVCALYANVDHRSGCASEVPAAAPDDTILGYLYEGMNRISYTGHEFWMMFNIPEYRNKVFFTNGTQVVVGNTVDRFLMWQGGVRGFVTDPGGLAANYPATAGMGVPVAFRFQGFFGANNNRAFYQQLISAFLGAYHPRVIISAEML